MDHFLQWVHSQSVILHVVALGQLLKPIVVSTNKLEKRENFKQLWYRSLSSETTQSRSFVKLTKPGEDQLRSSKLFISETEITPEVGNSGFFFTLGMVAVEDLSSDIVILFFSLLDFP